MASPKQVVVFRAEKVGREVFYDMTLNGRVLAYELFPDDFAGALRRARISPTEVWVEDLNGYRERMTR